MVTQTDVKSLGELICGRRILIPPIQRDYAWDKSAEQMYNDLLQFYTNSSSSNYYMGNLIAWVETDEEDTELFDHNNIWQLLDGQQRVTSLTILLNSILLELNNYDTQASITATKEIEDKFLFVSEELESDKWHASLKPRRAESRDFLKWLIEESSHDESIKSVWLESKGNDLSLIVKVAISYSNHIKKFIRDNGVDELISFYQLMRDRVLLG